MKCCNYDERCPEWTVIKNKFILVDDWNNTIYMNLGEVDDILPQAIFKSNARGVIINKINTEGLYPGDLVDNKSLLSVYMTKTQYNDLVNQWKKFKKKNKKLFEE